MTPKPWGRRGIGAAQGQLQCLEKGAGGEGGNGRALMLSPQHNPRSTQQKTQRGVHHGFRNAPQGSMKEMPFYTNPVLHPTPQRSSKGRRRKTPKCFPRTGNILKRLNLGEKAGASVAHSFHLPTPAPQSPAGTPNTKIPSEILDKMH